jgi:hypothetical protein
MELADFEEDVEPIIYERGMAYYDSGAVIKLKQSRDTWIAEVSGTQEYSVRVKLGEQGRVIESECNCPYDRGDICKHEVAVYLAIAERLRKDGGLKASLPPPSEVVTDLDTILSGLGRDELVDLVKEQAKSDAIFRSMVITDHNSSLYSKESYRRIILLSVDSAMGHQGFIPNTKIPAACRGARLVLDKAEKLIDEGKPADALSAAQAVLENMLPVLQVAEDLEDGIGSCIKMSLELFRKALKHDLGETARESFFDYLVRECKNSLHISRDMWAELLEITIEFHSGSKEADEILQSVETLFADGKVIKKYQEDEGIVYRMKLIALNRTGKEEAAKKFFEENSHVAEFRRMSLEKAFNEKDFDKVTVLAKSGIKHDSRVPGLVKEWKKWELKSRVMGNETDNIRKLCLDFFLEVELEFYEIYKNTYSHIRWPRHLRKLIERLSRYSKYDQKSLRALGYLLSQEKEWEKLLSLLAENPKMIPDYEHLLLQACPEKFCSMLADSIRKKAESAKNRNDYWRLCNYSLKHLHGMKVDGAEKAVLGLIEEFRSKYQNRPLMMEELDKFRNKLD